MSVFNNGSTNDKPEETKPAEENTGAAEATVEISSTPDK